MDLTGVHIFSLSEVCFDFPLGDCNSAFGRTNAGQLTYWIGLINCTSGFFLWTWHFHKFCNIVVPIGNASLNYSPSIGMTFWHWESQSGRRKLEPNRFINQKRDGSTFGVQFSTRRFRAPPDSSQASRSLKLDGEIVAI